MAVFINYLTGRIFKLLSFPPYIPIIFTSSGFNFRTVCLAAQQRQVLFGSDCLTS